MNRGLLRWWVDHVGGEVIASVTVAVLTGGGLGYVWRFHEAALLLVGLIAVVLGAVWAITRSSFMPRGLISVIGFALLWPVFVQLAGVEATEPPETTITTSTVNDPNDEDEAVRDLEIDCAPATIAPGDTLTITYTVDSQGDEGWDLGLGAELVGEGDPIFDPDHDATRPFLPGRTERTRRFTVDETTPPGHYELAAAVWKGEVGSQNGDVLDNDSCRVTVQLDEGLATIDCPQGAERYGSAVPRVRGTAEISLLSDDQQLWLVAWSEAPLGAGSAAYLESELTNEAWERRDVVIAEPDEPTGMVELRVYAFTQAEVDLATQRLERNDPAGAYLTDTEISSAPQDRVQITRNAPAPISTACR